MAERAAHLLDHVFPDVPVRQWVLSLPYRLRYQLAWDHELCRSVVAVFVRACSASCALARSATPDRRAGAVPTTERRNLAGIESVSTQRSQFLRAGLGG